MIDYSKKGFLNESVSARIYYMLKPENGYTRILVDNKIVLFANSKSAEDYLARLQEETPSFNYYKHYIITPTTVYDYEENRYIIVKSVKELLKIQNNLKNP